MQLIRVVYACTLLYNLCGTICEAVHAWEREAGLGGEAGWAGQQAGIMGDMLQLFKVKMERLEKSEKQLRQSIGTLISTNVQLRIDAEEASNKFSTLEAELRQQIKGLQTIVQQLVQSNRDTEGRLTVLTELQKVSAERRDEDSEARESYIQEVCQSQGEDMGQQPAQNQRTGQHNTMSGDGDRTSLAAFTAYRDGTASEGVTNQDAPVYNRVLLNVGGAYNIDTGVFTTPVSGLYLFSWTWKGRQGAGEDRWYGLVVNGHQQVGVGTCNYADNDIDQSSTFAVLRLTEGDKVWTTPPGNQLGADKDKTNTNKDRTSADKDKTSTSKDGACADKVKISAGEDRTSPERDRTSVDKDAKTREMGAERSASFTGVLLHRELDNLGP